MSAQDPFSDSNSGLYTPTFTEKPLSTKPPGFFAKLFEKGKAKAEFFEGERYRSEGWKDIEEHRHILDTALARELLIQHHQ